MNSISRVTLFFASISFLLLFFTRINAQPRESFSFALLSDTHVNENGTAASDDLVEAVRDINAMPDIEFVIITGDITEFDSDAELMKADSILQQLNKPLHVIPGNHDTNWSESGTNSFRQILGEERFAFTTHGILFVGCGCGMMNRKLVSSSINTILENNANATHQLTIDYFSKEKHILLSGERGTPKLS